MGFMMTGYHVLLAFLIAYASLVNAGKCKEWGPKLYDLEEGASQISAKCDYFMGREVFNPTRDFEESADTIDELWWIFLIGRALPRAKLFKTEAFKQYLDFKTLVAESKNHLAAHEYNPSFAARLAEVSQGDIHADDAVALGAISSTLSCSDARVSCNIVGGQLRVIGLMLTTTSRAIASALQKLKFLRTLMLYVKKLREHSEDFKVLHLPNLEALWLHHDEGRRAQSSASIDSWMVRQSSLQVLDVSGMNLSLDALCELKKLKRLRLVSMGIHSLPHCFRNLREMRSIDLRGNYLREAPAGLAGLPELRSIVAFRQGEFDACEVSGKRKQVPTVLLEAESDRSKCKRPWDTKLGPEDKHDEPLMVCPSLSMGGTLWDWMELGLPKLEKLWLDGGFIRGSIPADLPGLWPAMASLDLYSNELTGPIPESLGNLPLRKLNLHDNNLSGAVPKALFRLPICQLGLAGNPQLHGCIPRGYLDNERRRPFPGSNITLCKARIDEL